MSKLAGKVPMAADGGKGRRSAAVEDLWVTAIGSASTEWRRVVTNMYFGVLRA